MSRHGRQIAGADFERCRRVAVYRRAAVTHRAQILAMLVGLAIAALTTSIAIAALAAVLAEALVVTLLPHSVAFRRTVDRRFERVARAAAAKERASLLARISDVHQRELVELERLAAEVRHRVVHVARQTPDAAIEQSADIGALLALYARLALTHQRRAAWFDAESKTTLEAEAARLAVLEAPCPQSAEWIARRRAVAGRRQATWMRAAEQQRMIAHGLAMIADIIRCIHDLCGLAQDDICKVEIDEVLAAHGSELARFSPQFDDGGIDASLFELVPTESDALCSDL